MCVFNVAFLPFTHSTPRHFSYLLKTIQQTLKNGKRKDF